MNGTTDILNPFAQMITDAADIRNALHTAVTDLELAIEAEATARRTAKEARESYEAAEAEFVAETLPARSSFSAPSFRLALKAAMKMMAPAPRGTICRAARRYPMCFQ